MVPILDMANHAHASNASSAYRLQQAANPQDHHVLQLLVRLVVVAVAALHPRTRHSLPAAAFGVVLSFRPKMRHGAIKPLPHMCSSKGTAKACLHSCWVLLSWILLG